MTDSAEPTVEWRRTVESAVPHLRLGAVLGGGPAGWVLAARSEPGAEPVVVKALAGEALADPAIVAARRTEGELLCELCHPHVVRGRGVIETADALVIVMEHIEGSSVFDVARASRLPRPTACAVLVAAAEGAHALHGAGYLHGDLKPENLLLADDGRHRIVDLGLARRWPFPVRRALAGTPPYLAPEAIGVGAAMTPAADVYALGMVAYELLSGFLPFGSSSDPVEVMRQQLDQTPFPLMALAPDVPLGLSRLVMKAIDRDPARRPDSAENFAALVAAESRSLPRVGARP